MERLALAARGGPDLGWTRPKRARKRPASSREDYGTADHLEATESAGAAAFPPPGSQSVPINGIRTRTIRHAAEHSHPERQRALSAGGTLRSLLGIGACSKTFQSPGLSPIVEATSKQPSEDHPSTVNMHTRHPPRTELLSSFQYESFDFDEDVHHQNIGNIQMPAFAPIAQTETRQLDLFQDRDGNEII